MSTTMTRNTIFTSSSQLWPPCASAALGADTKPGVVPDGWTTAAPRDEIRPKFAYDARGGRDGKGAFVITADGREGLDGWWTKTIAVRGCPLPFSCRT